MSVCGWRSRSFDVSAITKNYVFVKKNLFEKGCFQIRLFKKNVRTISLEKGLFEISSFVRTFVRNTFVRKTFVRKTFVRKTFVRKTFVRNVG